MNTRTRKRERDSRKREVEAAVSKRLAERGPAPEDSSFKPLSVEDFHLSPDELQTLVEGSQKFLAPTNDEEAVDADSESATSLEHGNQS